MSGPPPSISFETKPPNLIGCHVNRNVKFAKKNIKKKELIRSYNGDKYKPLRKYCFYCRCLSTLVAMETFNFHRLIMGKMKTDIYCYFIADILTKVFLKCLLSGPLPNIYFLSKPLNSRIKLQTNIQKSTRGGWSWPIAEMFIALGSTNSCCICTLVWQQSFRRLKMGKMNITCSLIADILTELFYAELSFYIAGHSGEPLWPMAFGCTVYIHMGTAAIHRQGLLAQ